MHSFLKKAVCFACAAGAVFCLSGCGGDRVPAVSDEIITLPTAPIEAAGPETTSPMELVEELTTVMEAGELYTLDHYPNLKSVDLTGSTCYDTILEYAQTHPQVKVTYAVSFGLQSVSNDSSSATLMPQGLEYDLLLENLRYLPELKSLSLPEVALSADQLEALSQTYPEVSFDYTVELLGKSCPSSTTTLDLSSMSSAQVDAACSKLGLLTNLTDVTLSSSLSMADVDKLQASNPGALFHYTFTLFGQTLDTAAETVEFKNQAIGNEGESQIRQALDILDNCTRFVLDNCQLDYEVLAQIREDYREKTKVVWRVYFGVTNRYTALTDQETIRAVYNVTDDTVGPLRYCEDAKYIDMGHNDTLTDLTFVGYMPKLEVFIGSGCAATELVGWENAKSLVWLELANCMKLENIDVLENCENLKYLNLSYTKVKTFQMLDSLPLERFVYLRPKASGEEQKMFKAIHEDCLTVFSGSQPYGYGWRYNDNGKTYFDYYKNVIREVFDLDRVDALVKQGMK